MVSQQESDSYRGLLMAGLSQPGVSRWLINDFRKINLLSTSHANPDANPMARADKLIDAAYVRPPRATEAFWLLH